jgi:hypothetical protein
MWRKILNITLLALSLAGLMALVGFVESGQREVKCKGLEITID